MEKGINLSLTKSLADFDALLDRIIEAVSTKKLSVDYELTGASLSKFQVGKYVHVDGAHEDEVAVFWFGFGWEEGDKRESLLWIEFDKKTCSKKYWEKLKKLVGTSGKYYSGIDSEFEPMFNNTWIHFFLKQEYLAQFYDAEAGLNTQEEILLGFVNEVLEKL